MSTSGTTLRTHFTHAVVGSESAPINVKFMMHTLQKDTSISSLSISITGNLFEVVTSDGQTIPLSNKDLQIIYTTPQGHDLVLDAGATGWKCNLTSVDPSSTTACTFDISIIPPANATFSRIAHMYYIQLSLKLSNGSTLTKTENFELIPDQLDTAQIVLSPFSTLKQPASASISLEDRFKNCISINPSSGLICNLQALCINEENKNSGQWLCWQLTPKNKRVTTINSINFNNPGIHKLEMKIDEANISCLSNTCIVSRDMPRSIQTEWLTWLDVASWGDVKVACSHDTILGTAVGINIISVSSANNDKTANINKLERIMPYSTIIYAHQVQNSFELYRRDKLIDKDMNDNLSSSRLKSLGSERSKVLCIGTAKQLGDVFNTQDKNISQQVEPVFIIIKNINVKHLRAEEIAKISGLWNQGLMYNLIGYNHANNLYNRVPSSDILYTCVLSDRDNVSSVISTVSTPMPMSMLFNIAKAPMACSKLYISNRPGLSYNRHIHIALSLNENIDKVVLLRGIVGTTGVSPIKEFSPNDTFFEIEHDDFDDLNTLVSTNVEPGTPLMYYFVYAEGKDREFILSSPIWILA